MRMSITNLCATLALLFTINRISLRLLVPLVVLLHHVALQAVRGRETRVQCVGLVVGTAGPNGGGGLASVKTDTSGQGMGVWWAGRFKDVVNGDGLRHRRSESKRGTAQQG